MVAFGRYYIIARLVCHRPWLIVRDSQQSGLQPATQRYRSISKSDNGRPFDGFHSMASSRCPSVHCPRWLHSANSATPPWLFGQDKRLGCKVYIVNMLYMFLNIKLAFWFGALLGESVQATRSGTCLAFQSFSASKDPKEFCYADTIRLMDATVRELPVGIGGRRRALGSYWNPIVGLQVDAESDRKRPKADLFDLSPWSRRIWII